MKRTGKENLVIINDREFVHCPVCGTLTAVYDICGGPNQMTLAEARRAYANGEKIK